MDHLRSDTREWVDAVLERWTLDEHHGRLLLLAANAWDRATEARELIAEHGITYTDRFGAPRMRPEVAVERDSRLAFARLIRDLDLDEDGPGVFDGLALAERRKRAR